MVRGGPPVPDGGSAEGLVTLPLYRKELASLMLVFLGVSLAFRGLRPSFEAPASLIPVLLGKRFRPLKGACIPDARYLGIRLAFRGQLPIIGRAGILDSGLSRRYAFRQ